MHFFRRMKRDVNNASECVFESGIKYFNFFKTAAQLEF